MMGIPRCDIGLSFPDSMRTADPNMRLQKSGPVGGKIVGVPGNRFSSAGMVVKSRVSNFQIPDKSTTVRDRLHSKVKLANRIVSITTGSIRSVKMGPAKQMVGFHQMRAA